MMQNCAKLALQRCKKCIGMNLGSKMRLLAHFNYIDVVAKTGSIRKAADRLNITSTALNRRILALEDELGTPIFERLPQGVRLNVAGELMIQHIRHSMADLSRVTSQIADLSGVRRGHVNIACTAEIVGGFMPSRIAAYRNDHSGVTFDISKQTPTNALRALSDLAADLSVIFGPIPPAEFQILATVQLDAHIVVAEAHPLASRENVRFVDIQQFPTVVPAEGSGLSDLLMSAQTRRGLALNKAISTDSFEFMANYHGFEDTVSFALPLHEMGPASGSGARSRALSFVYVPLHPTDRMTGLLHLVQAKGRVLPVAAAKFAEELVQYFNEKFPADTN